MILCGTELRPPRQTGMDALLRLATESGCAGVGIGRACLLGEASQLIVEALRAGLIPGVVRAPLPERVLPARQRLPYLAAPSGEERAAAIDLVRRGLELAGGAGMRAVMLDFGPLTLGASFSKFARCYGRRECDEDEPGAIELAAALSERRARAPGILDACQWSLEKLLADAERRGVTLALDLAVTPWGVPSPREGLEIVARFGGARLGVVFDVGKLSVMRALGLAIAPERLTVLRATAAVVVENDAVGIEAGYLPGLGERDDDLGLGTGLPGDVPVVVIGATDCTDDEVATATAAATRRYA